MRLTVELANKMHNLNSSLWFRPTMMTFGSMALAFGTVIIDKQIGVPSLGFFSAGADDARAMLSSITSSMLTVTTVTFSIMMVALVLASQQFSPRIIRNVMRDNPSQYVLGAFIGTFVYSLLVLGRITDTQNILFVPVVSLTTSVIMTLICIAAFIYFIHHIAETIQAHVLIARTGERTIEVLQKRFPETKDVGFDNTQTPVLPTGVSRVISSSSNGYIQAIDAEMLLEFAQKHDLVVEMLRAVGDFVPMGNPLVRVWQRNAATCREFSRDEREAFEDVFEIGVERTLFNDMLFGLRQLVDVALKAISPGINDPNTASNAVDYIGDVLVQTARRPDPNPYRVDDAGILRVVTRPVTFDLMLETAFNQIRQYARSEVTITIRLLEILNEVAFATDDQHRRRSMWKHITIIMRGADRGIIEAYDRELINQRLVALAASLNRSAEDLLLETTPFVATH